MEDLKQEIEEIIYDYIEWNEGRGLIGRDEASQKIAEFIESNYVKKEKGI